MSAQRSKNPQARIPELKLTTPKAPCMWPKLDEPDTKFKEEGEYSITVVMTPEDAEPLTAKAEAHLNTFIKEQAKLLGKKTIARANTSPWKPDTDQDGNETGNVRFNIKMKASAITKSGRKLEFTPAVFDAYGKPIDPSFGSGSLVRVNFEVVPWYSAALGAGVQFRLNAVQVLESRGKSKSDNAKDYGFDVVEAADPATLGSEEGLNPNESTGGGPASGGDF